MITKDTGLYIFERGERGLLKSISFKVVIPSGA